MSAKAEGLDSVVAAATTGRTLLPAVAGFSLAALAILIAATFLTHAAEQIADQSGLGRTLVGTTLVALCSRPRTR